MSPPRPRPSLASLVVKGLALGAASSIAALLALRSSPRRNAPEPEPAGFALEEPLTAAPPTRYAEPASRLYEPEEPAPPAAPSPAPRAAEESARRPFLEGPPEPRRRSSSAPRAAGGEAGDTATLTSFARGTRVGAAGGASAAPRPAGSAAPLSPRAVEPDADDRNAAPPTGPGRAAASGTRTSSAGIGAAAAHATAAAPAVSPAAPIHPDTPAEFAAIRSKLVRGIPLTDEDRRSAIALAQEEADRFAELADSAHGDAGPASAGPSGFAPVGGAEPFPAPPAGARHWPLGDARAVTQPFGCTGFYLEPPYRGCPHFHEALDIAAAAGTPIRAFEGGKVIAAVTGCETRGDCRCYGNHVVVAHPDGLTTLYAHMRSAAVAAGQPVAAGQTLGYEGSTGCSTGPHVHFVVRRSRDGSSGEYVDPRDVLP